MMDNVLFIKPVFTQKEALWKGHTILLLNLFLLDGLIPLSNKKRTQIQDLLLLFINFWVRAYQFLGFIKNHLKYPQNTGILAPNGGFHINIGCILTKYWALGPQ